MQVLQRVDRAALLFRGTADDVDEIDVVADLRDRAAADDAVQRRGDVLGGDAELPRLVLQHVDLHDARRFVPVEGESADDGMRADDSAEFLRQLAHRLEVRAADTRYCTGRPTGGPMFQKLHVGVGADEVFAQDLLSLLPARASRASSSLVTMTICPKEALAGCTSKDSRKRGAPCPT